MNIAVAVGLNDEAANTNAAVKVKYGCWLNLGLGSVSRTAVTIVWLGHESGSC